MVTLAQRMQVIDQHLQDTKVGKCWVEARQLRIAVRGSQISLVMNPEHKNVSVRTVGCTPVSS